MLGMWLAELIVVLLYIVLGVIPLWRLVGKAGFSTSWKVMTLMPIVGALMVHVLAFVEWPIEQELKSLRGSGHSR